MKFSSSPDDVLPTALFIKVFDSTDPCIVELFNTPLVTGVLHSSFKHAVEPVL